VLALANEARRRGSVPGAVVGSFMRPEPRRRCRVYRQAAVRHPVDWQLLPFALLRPSVWAWRGSLPPTTAKGWSGARGTPLKTPRLFSPAAEGTTSLRPASQPLGFRSPPPL